jgi:predicted transcriptional regulator
MKTTTIPSLRVTPEFRHDAESVLREGETLSAFVEASIRSQVEYRQMQHAFIERGLEARETANALQQYASKRDVMDSLTAILDAGRAKE